jgi:hypothetical protein
MTLQEVRKMMNEEDSFFDYMNMREYKFESLDEEIVAEAAQPVAKPVSTSAAAEKIQLENLAPQVNEDFFQFWARVLDTT